MSRFYVPNPPSCICVLYMFTFPNGKQYVGVSTRFRLRFHRHWHDDFAVGRAMRKYGRENIAIDFVPCDSEEDAYDLERQLVISLGTLMPSGYNLKEGGGEHAQFTEEVRLRISAAGKGRKHSQESKQKISEANKGKKISDEQKDKLKHRVLSEETRSKMSAAAKLRGTIHMNSESAMAKKRASLTGKKHSEETRKIISQKAAGRFVSDETRARMSERRKGKPGAPCSESTKIRLREINLGKKHSEETKRKISENSKRYWLERLLRPPMIAASLSRG